MGLSRIFFRRLVLVCLVLLASAAQAEIITGKVIGVVDGDTIDVLDVSNTPHRIRLEGVDAPERAQPFGARSKQHLSDQVFGKQVQVQWSKTDLDGRTIGKVLINGFDANLEQVRAGLAWHYKQYQKNQSPSDRIIYSRAEDVARLQQIGLWADANPMSPWEWRHSRKTRNAKHSAAPN